MADNVPKTIGELKAYARENGIPLEKIHVHLDENYYGAKAYGIYRDGDEVIVYKNKANGSRAIHYQGTDEAYAVSELYLKMREMVMAGMSLGTLGNSLSSGSSLISESSDYQYYVEHNSERMNKGTKGFRKALVVVIMIIVLAVIAHASSNSNSGRYSSSYDRDHDSYDRDSYWDDDDDWDFDYDNDWDWDSDW